MSQEIETTKNLTLPINEQETHISYMRDESFAEVYTSDSTQITRFDKLCKNSPEMYQLIEDTGRGKMYRIEDKKLVSFRASKRQYTPEQKEEMGKRLAKSRVSNS